MSEVLCTLYFVLCTSFFLLCTFLFLPSCKKDAAPPDLGYGYCPNNVGHWVIYQIDSTAQDDRFSIDTTYHFQVKEVIASIYTDNSGRPTMRLERYRKNFDPLVPYSQQQWGEPHVFSANLTRTTYERVEENFRYTRMIFPVKRGPAWNANANNVLEKWDSKYSSVDQPDNTNSLSFDSVATVEEENSINAVDSKYALAKYAKHAGLIYRQVILLSKQNSGQDTIGLTNPTNYNLLSQKAILLTQKIISWGD